MDAIEVTGGIPLHGTIEISGAKNAALPIMAAGLLTAEPLTLENVPHLLDVTTMASLLAEHGAEITLKEPKKPALGHTLTIHAAKITNTTAPYDIVRKMRASVTVLGPILSRCGHTRVSLPGGCAIGTRPINYHLDALKAMGAEITLTEGYVDAVAPKGLHGAKITFPTISVGATENILMAATLAKGTTVITNAAEEPEVTDLAECLVKMGAKIDGIGSHRLEIEGVDALHGATHPIVADRIEAGTFAIAAAITGGRIILERIPSRIMQSTLDMLEKSGCNISVTGDTILVENEARRIHPVDLTTAPYPSFATDMQAQFMALLVLADGTSTIRETIFENRFMHVQEMARMGADIAVDGSVAVVRGVKKLKGAPVMATDLRASVGLVLAALAAEGTTKIGRVYHLDRGYERLESKLAACGAKIKRVRE